MQDGDRLPLTTTIEADVRSAFAVPNRQGGMERSSLLSALEKLEPGEQPLEDALANAGFMPANAEDAAILRWIDSSFAHWRQEYPLEDTLQQLITNTRPLAAAFAITDDRFFIPGGHGLHRLLDTIFSGLNGWQSTLSGSQNSLDGIRETLQMSTRDFPSEPQVDNTRTTFDQTVQEHQNRLKNLDSIILERESALLKDSSARLRTAIVINQLLATQQVPGSVARFIKSDWFESGVIIADRYGFNSDAWDNYTRTGQLLVEAVQPVAEIDAEGQRRLHQTMQQLPHTLSRQLESLLPDSEAVDGAVGLIEYALIRNMRSEDMGLVSADPIRVSNLPEEGPPSDQDLAEAGIHPGHWYLLDGVDGPQRIRLVSSLVSNIYLLFMDYSGARADRMSSANFLTLLDSGEARCIEITDSFCRAMVEVTNIQAVERRATSVHEMAERASHEAKERVDMEHQLRHSASSDPIMTQHLDQEGTKHDTVAATHQPDTEHYLDIDPSPSATQEDETQQSAYSDAGEYTDNTAQPNAILNSAGRNNMPTGEPLYENRTIVKLQIPVGTWIGFHDRNPPLMARIAVRDPEKDSYIFTDREGIKLRELTATQLIALIDRDMVDILERKTNFRDTVNAMRQEQQERLN